MLYDEEWKSKNPRTSARWLHCAFLGGLYNQLTIFLFVILVQQKTFYCSRFNFYKIWCNVFRNVKHNSTTRRGLICPIRLTKGIYEKVCNRKFAIFVSEIIEKSPVPLVWFMSNSNLFWIKFISFIYSHPCTVLL